ncbi:pectinesterase-like [Cannabis sativa]|uniref:pectinesterase-like n=1 Tax=Cannabis sativa TaxID=3483 RepID=UPI0029CA496F|nr:pectinesterase-like [Cannabis sativa]
MYNCNGSTRPKLLYITIPISAILLLITLIFSPKTNKLNPHNLHFHKHYQIANSACQGSLYPKLCVSTVASFPDLISKSLPQIISLTVNHTMSEVRASSANCTFIERRFMRGTTTIQKRALDDCVELLDDTVSELEAALSDLTSKKSASSHYNDLQTLLSGALTNQGTCLDGLNITKQPNSVLKNYVQNRIVTISNHVSNILAMLKKIPAGKHGHFTTTSSDQEDEIFPEYGHVINGFPTWVSSQDQTLLVAPVNESKIDLIVAKDGTGNFTTVAEAVAVAPNSSDTRFVIYIKAGAYLENVEVVKKKTNLMFLGDGIGKTVIKGSRNHVDGWTTFRSATVAVVGSGFIAKGITFENSAGPSKHQAVALRSGSDLSAFYLCSFVGYQDTLYAHSLRQFYRECDIYGTVDFVFGNAAVVFQNCNLYARKPNENQRNMFTAQGREDPNQNTGISILNCKLAAAADLVPVRSNFKTYLGRPWKEYSRTVIMKSYIDESVEPAGWLEWNGTFALSTLYYGEYMNRGPGSNTSARVTWPGYRVINSSVEASKFTVGAFIQGLEWLNFTKVPYFSTLG